MKIVRTTYVLGRITACGPGQANFDLRNTRAGMLRLEQVPEREVCALQRVAIHCAGIRVLANVAKECSVCCLLIFVVVVFVICILILVLLSEAINSSH